MATVAVARCRMRHHHQKHVRNQGHSLFVNPLITVIDLVVYVLGTFSFWLEVAPLSLVLDGADLFVKKTKKSYVSKRKYRRGTTQVTATLETLKSHHDQLCQQSYNSKVYINLCHHFSLRIQHFSCHRIYDH